MPKRTERSALIDGILRIAAFGGLTAVALLAPNSLELFDKPLQAYLGRLDQRAREREFRTALRYMKNNHLFSENYQHGLQVTKKAKRRLLKHDIDNLKIEIPNKWDGSWRLVFFDIPEVHKSRRDKFAGRLKVLGFKVLQRSVFVYPFSSREAISYLAHCYKVQPYVSFIETTHIDNHKALVYRFRSIIP